MNSTRRPTITPEDRASAMREMKNPTMAYDVINTSNPTERVNTGKNHPLAWMLKPQPPTDPTPFFRKLTQAVRQELREKTGRYGSNYEQAARFLEGEK